MRHLFKLLIALAALMAAGCYPTTQEPIGIATGSVSDTRLFGVWQGQISGQSGNIYLFFLAHDPEPAEAMLVRAGAGDKEKGNWATFSIVLGKTGNHTIINALFDGGGVPRDENPDFTPLLYTLDAGGILRLFTLDTIGIEDAVRANRLAGDVIQNQTSADVTLTGDPQTIDEFFAVNAPKYFNQPFGTFQRIN